MTATIRCCTGSEFQMIWVSNGLKDVFYEAVVEMTRAVDPVAAKEMESGRLLGLYGISGLGFDIDDFVEYIGSQERFIEITQAGTRFIEQVCGNPICTQNLTKLFKWVWFLLQGGTLNNSSDRSPMLSELPDEPPSNPESPNPVSTNPLFP